MDLACLSAVSADAAAHPECAAPQGFAAGMPAAMMRHGAAARASFSLRERPVHPPVRHAGSAGRRRPPAALPRPAIDRLPRRSRSRRTDPAPPAFPPLLLGMSRSTPTSRRNLRRELHRMREARVGPAFAVPRRDDRPRARHHYRPRHVRCRPGRRRCRPACSISMPAGCCAASTWRQRPAFADWLDCPTRGWPTRSAGARSPSAAATRSPTPATLRGALREAHRLIADDSLQEAHFRRVMRLHQRLGEREAALDAFERCRKALGRELGLRPLPETAALAEAIRSSDVDVAATPPSTAATLYRALVPEKPLLVGRAPTIATIARVLCAGGSVAIEAAAGVRRCAPARRAGGARPRLARPCGTCQRRAGTVRGARPLAARCPLDRQSARARSLGRGGAGAPPARAGTGGRGTALRPAAPAPLRGGPPGLAFVVRHERCACLRRLAVRRRRERALVALVARSGIGPGRRRPAPGGGARRGGRGARRRARRSRLDLDPARAARRAGNARAGARPLRQLARRALRPAALACHRRQPAVARLGRASPTWSRRGCSASMRADAGRRLSTTPPRTIADCRFRRRCMLRSPPASAGEAAQRLLEAASLIGDDFDPGHQRLGAGRMGSAR